FPISLVKTCDLDSSKNYVFGYHPHGIVSLGAWINFATEANHVSDFFPGLRIRLLTLSSNFHVPFWRELLLSLGLASVSRRSCDNILSQGPGNSCMIVVGGAAEALNAFPYTQDLVIKRRLGFIKLAIRRGASLVPCYSFGENDLWDQVPNPEGSLLRKFQHLMQKYTTISPPLFHGRGVWNYNIGIVPFRRPVTTVVGAPIHCVKTSHPSNEMVLEYQQRYMAALEDLWHTYKDKYAPYRKSEMAFVE
ncbi:diacylglycerol-acyltransferase, partial [Caulochytrium protostelioides]